MYILRPNNFIPSYMPRRKESLSPPMKIYKDIYISFLHHSPKWKTTQMSINVKMDNKLWYIHTIK